MTPGQAVAFVGVVVALSCLGAQVYGEWHEWRFVRRKFANNFTQSKEADKWQYVLWS